jgi:stage V sporulation protein AB
VKAIGGIWLICLSQGIIAGSAWVALLTVLGIVPRLATLGRPRPKIRILEVSILGGSLAAAIFDTGGTTFVARSTPLERIALVPTVSLLAGLFVGMLAASLAEVLNVLPILCRRFDIARHVTYLVTALAVGKAVGSLIGFLLGQ